MAGPDCFPVLAENSQEPGGEHDVPVLVSLGLADADDHALAINVVDAKVTDLREPQPGGVGGHQDGPVLEVSNSLEELDQFIKAQNDRQLFLLLGADNGLDDPIPAQGDAVEELQGAAGLVEIAPGDMTLLHQIEQVRADLLWAQALGRDIVVPSKRGYALDVNLDGMGREIAQGHVLDHATAQRTHGRVLSG